PLHLAPRSTGGSPLLSAEFQVAPQLSVCGPFWTELRRPLGRARSRSSTSPPTRESFWQAHRKHEAWLLTLRVGVSACLTGFRPTIHGSRASSRSVKPSLPRSVTPTWPPFIGRATQDLGTRP